MADKVSRALAADKYADSNRELQAQAKANREADDPLRKPPAAGESESATYMPRDAKGPNQVRNSPGVEYAKTLMSLRKGAKIKKTRIVRVHAKEAVLPKSRAKTAGKMGLLKGLQSV